MNTKRVLLLATLLMLILLSAVAGMWIVRAREEARRSRAKGYLTHVHFIVWQAADLTGEVPETIRRSGTAESPVAHSWRAIVLLPQASVVDGMAMYRLDEAWSSTTNRQCAERVIDMNGNYFAGGAGRDFPQAVDDCAHILAVTEPSGAWSSDEPLSADAFFEERADRLAFVVVPDSPLKMFQPADIDFETLEEAVQTHGKIYGLTAGKTFVVLTAETIDRFNIERRDDG